MDELVRVRFAPSPTGKLHFGSARTALFNYLFAKKFGGKFVLRIEDSDKVRSTPESEIDILEGLSWLGLSWDEGPMSDGRYGPYRQSERAEIYKEFIDRMAESKDAYYCFCSQEELAEEREKQEKAHQMPKYSGKCRGLSESDIAGLTKEGKKPAIRFKVSDEVIEFDDLIKGPMKFDMSLFGDFVIVGSDGNPLFLLTNLIDDSLMKISHVLRAEDHLSNTPKQLLLFKALGLMAPEYGHLPLILNPDKSKISKRKNPASLTEDFRDKGYLPEAMINFMALLGWHPANDKEIFSLGDLETEFSLDKVSKSPAIFDIQRLDYINGYYIRQKKIGDLANLCLPFMEKCNPAAFIEAQAKPEYLLQAVSMVQERMKRLDEICELTHYFFGNDLNYDAELLVPKNAKKSDIANYLKAGLAELQEIEIFGPDNLEKTLIGTVAKLKITNGELLWPIRVALTGEKASPGVFELLSVLGKERSLKRIQDAITKLEK
ncbi:MAG: glutamate--tRNA ligase [bacterium]|nr:glutamate--tRNA ligase [bacterium]